MDATDSGRLLSVVMTRSPLHGDSPTPGSGTGASTPRSRGVQAWLGVIVLASSTIVGAVAVGMPLGERAIAQTAPPAPPPVDESLPHTHTAIDSSQLTKAEEDALVARVEREGLGIRPDIVARRSGRISAAAAAASPAATTGSWEGPYDWPVLGVFVTLLPNGNVLAYDSVNDLRTEASTEHRFTRAMIFDPSTRAITRVDETLGFNIFCSGLAKLASGLVFTAGGNLNQALDGIDRSTTFDWTTNAWTEGPRMSQARWYPSVTPLPNGEMLVTGGGPALSEIRKADGTFRALTNASQAIWAKREYPWLVPAQNGSVAYIGPEDQIGALDTNGAGLYLARAARDGKKRSYGSFAAFAPGRVLVAGGGFFDNTSVVVDLATGATTPTGPMAHQRRQHNLTVLADGTVLATGGLENTTESLASLTAGVYDAEIYDPVSGQWRTVAPQERSRQYHSSALLLPDGRVLSSGGGMCGVCDSIGYFQRNAEIYSPPYLFAADGSPAVRPVITSVSGQLNWGSSYSLATPTPAKITKVALVRMGSVTHSVDMEQRYIPLSFTAGATSLSVTAPANANAAAPGWYLLFAIDDQGVPSVAAKVQIGSFTPPPTTTTTTTTTSTTTTTRPPTTTTTSTTTTLPPTTTTSTTSTTTTVPPSTTTTTPPLTTTTTRAPTTTTTTTTTAPPLTTTTRAPTTTTTTAPPTTTTTVAPTAGTGVVYDNGLRNGWLNWSWAVANLSAAGGRTGTAIEFEPDSWRGLYLRSDALPVVSTGVDLWINGRGGSQSVRIILSQNSALLGESVVTGLGAGWQQVSITTSRPVAAGTSLDLILQDWSGRDQAPVLVDDISLRTTATPPTTTTTAAPTTTTTVPATTTTRPVVTTTTIAPITTTSTTTSTTTTTTIPPAGSTVRTLYADAFVDANNWSWATNNPASTNPVKVGSRALAVATSPWTAAVFNLKAPLAITVPTKLEFWIHGGTAGSQSLTVQFFDGSTTRGSLPISTSLGGPIPANVWSKVSVDLAALGIISGQITDVNVWYGVGDPGSPYSLDDVRLVRG